MAIQFNDASGRSGAERIRLTPLDLCDLIIDNFTLRPENCH